MPSDHCKKFYQPQKTWGDAKKLHQDKNARVDLSSLKSVQEFLELKRYKCIYIQNHPNSTDLVAKECKNCWKRKLLLDFPSFEEVERLVGALWAEMRSYKAAMATVQKWVVLLRPSWSRAANQAHEIALSEGCHTDLARRMLAGLGLSPLQRRTLTSIAYWIPWGGRHPHTLVWRTTRSQTTVGGSC